ncbi:MAG TPA: RNA methyltransferase [Pseudobdellovibrionaceae bacterium]|nr:RNA methyltransferase [Pseudobdellovibrionaceae bacterium]
MKINPPTEIQSSENPLFKTWVTLLSSKGIKKQGQFLLSGKKIITELKPHFKVISEIRLKSHIPLRPDVPQYILSGDLFRQLDVVGTHSNLFLLEAPQIPTFDFNKHPQGIEVISPLGDPGNLGALARSCLAFGVKSLILTQESCHPFHPKALKASSGALLRLPLFRGPTLDEILAMNLEIYILDIQGDSMTDRNFPKNIRFLLGEEGPGLQTKKPNLKSSNLKMVRIETQDVESLNATVAASLFLFYLSRQRSS